MGFALPFQWDLPLLALALTGGCAALFTKRPAEKNSALLLPILVFLAATAVSAGMSINPARSLLLSSALLPALALYFVVSDYFPRDEHLRWLYLAHAAVALGLGVAILGVAWRRGGVIPYGFENWIADTGSPLLIVPNDAAYLGVIAPFSLALLIAPGRRTEKILAAASLLVVVLVTGLIQSRVAALALVVSLTAAAAFLRPRLALPAAMAILILLATIDGLRGFPLFTRIVSLWHPSMEQFWDARWPIWTKAWNTFLEDPILGQGPRTFQYASADGISVNWTHNLYLELLAEQGLAGLLSLGYLLATLAWTGAINLRRAREENRALCAAALAATLSFAAAAVFELSLVRQWVAVTLFALLGITGRLAAQRKGIPEESPAGNPETIRT